MITYYSNRACGILFNFIKNNPSGYYILPANICPVVPLTIIKAGSQVLFVDISTKTLQIDPNACESFINKYNVVGVVVVATYGNYNYSYNIVEKLRSFKSDILIIEDRCLCAPLDQTNLNPSVDLVLYSTGYAKVLDLGYGGIGLTNKEFISVEIIDYKEEDYHTLDSLYKDSFKRKIQLNCYEQLNWLDTSMLAEDAARALENDISIKLDKSLEHKRLINNIYNDLLPDSIKFQDSFNLWRYNIKIDNSDLIIREIFNQNLFVSKHYQPSSQLFKDQQYVNAESLYDNVINLFNDFHITEHQAISICHIINKFYDYV